MLKTMLRRLFATPRARSSLRDWREQTTVLQQSGAYAEAAALCEARLREDPEDADAQQMRAAALFGLRHTAEGLACLHAAAKLAPGDGNLQLHIGRVCSAMGQLQPALAAYRSAHALDIPEAAGELAMLLKTIEGYDEAEDCLRAALLRSTTPARDRHRLAGVLFEQGRVPEAIAELRDSLALEPEAAAVHSDLLRALNYADGLDPQAIFEEHRSWARRHADPLAEGVPPLANEISPERRLRVGYVSPYFRKHAVTFFLESVLAAGDRSAFDIYLYADVARPDSYSERLKGYGLTWRDTLRMSDEALAQKVREDRIDVLVDLSGHTPGNRLLAFARRPAPVQVTWNGYPNTTGMSAIDYRVSDALCDPPGLTEPLHSEHLVRLPGIYMSWRPPTDAPEPGPAPVLETGRITFGSFNSCYKLTPTVVGLWARVLKAVEGSRLIVYAVTGARAQSRLRELFAASGIFAGRVELRVRVSHEAFLKAHQEVDIALDSYPYHGTTTTCFSLWMGVPVVSLVGPTHVSRVGLTLLSSVDLDALAASDCDGYVEAAAALAQDAQRLAALRSGLRERMLASALTDGVACARSLESAYRRMWRDWCSETLGGTS